MNDEKTIFDNENTQYQSQHHENSSPSSEVVTNKNVPNKKPMWQRAAIGAGTGFAAGVAATVLTSGTTQAQVQEQEQDQLVADTDNHLAGVDGEVSVASSVNDDMSFGQAFAAARAEVGPGGVFEWHGGIYNTYYEEEWGNMSAAERAEFGSHFSWNEHHNDHTTNLHTQATTDEVTVTAVEHPGSEDVKPVSINEPTADNVSTESDHEVEILGVVHDDSGMNIGGMMINGHEAVVLDVDGDMTFDIIGVDMNDNHEFEDGELADISDAGVTVDHLGGISEPDIDQALDETIPDVGSYEC